MERCINMTINGREADRTFIKKKCTDKGYKLDETGTWRIYGEDPNCDFGGYHHEPLLETVQGVLEDVIEYAIGLDNFWQWGGGGKIEKVNTTKVIPRGYNPYKEEQEAARELIAEREKEIAKLKKKYEL